MSIIMFQRLMIENSDENLGFPKLLWGGFPASSSTNLGDERSVRLSDGKPSKHLGNYGRDMLDIDLDRCQLKQHETYI